MLLIHTPAVVANPNQIEAEVRAARNGPGWFVDRALEAEEKARSDRKIPERRYARTAAVALHQNHGCALIYKVFCPFLVQVRGTPWDAIAS